MKNTITENFKFHRWLKKQTSSSRKINKSEERLQSLWQISTHIIGVPEKKEKEEESLFRGIKMENLTKLER
jgi:hypothetical protein